MGVSKAASTWIHRCLQEHPGVFVPKSDSLRFFDLGYHRGLSTYEAHFAGAGPDQLRVDPSPTYLRSPVAAQRIARHYPQARFVLSLRNPAERAFSQFWHEKRKGRFDYTFDQVIEHFLMFPWIVEHGFYATHIENLLRHVPRDRVTIVLYNDLVEDPRRFLGQVLAGMALPAGFEPRVLDKRVNEAGANETQSMRAVRDLRGSAWLRPVRKLVKSIVGRKNLLRELGKNVSNRDEYDQGMSAAARETLGLIYAEEIDALARMTGMDFARWRQPIGPSIT